MQRAATLADEWLICFANPQIRQRPKKATSISYVERHSQPPANQLPRQVGDIFVFVDECHRTQSGKLHDAMKALLPGAMLIGFTGTPLLKSPTSNGVSKPSGRTSTPTSTTRPWATSVVLDLRYEARDIDQNITSQAKIDQWFDIKTKWAERMWPSAQLKQKLGHDAQESLSARDRHGERSSPTSCSTWRCATACKSGRGNAMLVSGSIYSACRFFEAVSMQTELTGKCAIVTSYRPTTRRTLKGEETGEGLTEKLRQYDAYRKMLADVLQRAGRQRPCTKSSSFEQEVKKRFIERAGTDEALNRGR